MRRKIPDILTAEEQKKLLDIFNQRYLSGQRNYLLIKTFLDTGLRLSEAINLKWNYLSRDISGDMKMKVVEGKNDKDRIVWLNDDLIEELNSWKERQTEEIGDCNHIFTTRNGDPLQPTYVQNMIYNYAEKSCIQEETIKHYRDEEGNKLNRHIKRKK